MNGINNYSNTEINIFAFIQEIILMWKPILLIGIISGLLVSGVKYYSDSSHTDESFHIPNDCTPEEYSKLADEQEARIKNTFSSSNEYIAEIKNVNNLILRVKNLKFQREYSENAAIMNINPYNVRTLRIAYDVIPSDNSFQNALALTKCAIKSDECYSILCSAVGADASTADIGTLIEASTTESSSTVYTNSTSVTQPYVYPEDNYPLITVSILLCDGWDEAALTNALNGYLYNYNIPYGNSISKGNNCIRYKTSSISTQYSPSIFSTQQSIKNAVISESSSLQDEISALSTDSNILLQLRLLSMGLHTDGSLVTIERYSQDYESSVSPTFSVKFLILGFCLGVFVFIFCILLYHLAKPCVGNIMGYGKLSTFSFLGYLQSESKSQIKNAFITSPFIYHITHKKGPIPLDELSNTISSIEYHSLKNNTQSITIITINAYSNQSISLLRELSEKWSFTSSHCPISIIEFHTSVPFRSELYENLLRIKDDVIIAIELNRTRIKDADCLYEFLNNNFNIIGIIAIITE